MQPRFPPGSKARYRENGAAPGLVHFSTVGSVEQYLQTRKPWEAMPDLGPEGSDGEHKMCHQHEEARGNERSIHGPSVSLDTALAAVFLQINKGNHEKSDVKRRAERRRKGTRTPLNRGQSLYCALVAAIPEGSATKDFKTCTV